MSIDLDGLLGCPVTFSAGFGLSEAGKYLRRRGDAKMVKGAGG